MTELEVRAATLADLQVVTETISLAFHDDPTWSWAFPDPARRQAHYAVFWRFMIGGAIRYPWVRMTDGGEAVAIWIPPGGTEVAPEDESGYEPLLQELSQVMMNWSACPRQRVSPYFPELMHS